MHEIFADANGQRLHYKRMLDIHSNFQLTKTEMAIDKFSTVILFFLLMFSVFLQLYMQKFACT